MEAGQDASLDIVIPVFNEGGNILRVLGALRDSVRTPFRVLICYDFDEDDTLAAIRSGPAMPFEVVPVKNWGRGPHRAVRTGFEASRAPAVLVLPADDDYNAGIIDTMVRDFREGAEIVCASRFVPGGRMEGAPRVKALLVRTASLTLYHLARLPVRDATNGFRLFSRRVLEKVPIESTEGFTYSIELLAKCHRLGWRISEVPSVWFERSQGKSRFRVMKWAIPYLRWYLYPFATTFLRRGPETFRNHG